MISLINHDSRFFLSVSPAKQHETYLIRSQRGKRGPAKRCVTLCDGRILRDGMVYPESMGLTGLTKPQRKKHWLGYTYPSEK